MFLYFDIFLCAVLIQGSYGNSDVQERIVGGSPTEIEKHPYQVYFGYSIYRTEYGLQNYSCGGSIISPRHILTAAHCVYGALHPYVRAGSTRAKTRGTKYTVTQMLPHPRSNFPLSLDYDVALLYLERDIHLDGRTTMMIRLPPSPVWFSTRVQPGTDVVVTGWGLTSSLYEGGQLAAELMALTVPVIPNADCNRIYFPKKVTPRMFCAGLPYRTSCQGDSGGPAVDSTTGVQVGVVSWGGGDTNGKDDCTKDGLPGVYADLTNFEILHWIRAKAGV